MEFLSDNLVDLNWWAIVLAVLSTMPVGYVWYDQKVGFGKKWAKLVGLSAKDMQDPTGMGKRFSVMLFVSLLTAILLAAMLRAFNINSAGDSLVFGIIVGFVIRGGAHFIHNGFAKRPDTLSLIDAGHDMLSIAVMSLILGLWV